MEPQRVLVTAAAAGIGRAIALAFADAGAHVHCCDIDGDAVSRLAAERSLLAVTRVDVTDGRQVDEWIASAVAELGGVDVLIANAGTSGPTAPIEDIAEDDWRACVDVCLTSQYLCARRVVPVMKRQRAGAIINMSSAAGLYGFGLRTPYAAAKWGVVGLTKSLAIELGPHGVRCNCICPGSVRGERMDRVIAADARERGRSVAEVEAEYLDGQSIARWVEPSEIADLCVFLASAAASMITGQAIAIDGHTETYHIA